jgi:hypothetical protein
VKDPWHTPFSKRLISAFTHSENNRSIFYLRPPKGYENLWRLFIGNLKRHVFISSFPWAYVRDTLPVTDRCLLNINPILKAFTVPKIRQIFTQKQK